MSLSLTLQEELNAAFAVAGSLRHNVVECMNCRVKSVDGDFLCDCADILAAYGEYMCKSCETPYRLLVGIHEYISEIAPDMQKDEAIHFAYDYYYLPPEPCISCTDLYRKDWEIIDREYKNWLSEYLKKFPAEHEYEDWASEQCCAKRGYCHCCGECP